jgi:transketolase
MTEIKILEQLAARIRSHILSSTTKAGSGHPTSSLSATELMTGLMFSGIFRYDTDNPAHPNNDRLIFSKGHASPLFYALWAAAGKITEETLMTMRKFDSLLEGHPTVSLPYVEASTGSLGQGLSIGLGMALNAKYLDKLPYRTYVLLGDSEMSEGSQWEAMQIASLYGLNNLIGIIDVNRLGQRGETMYGHEVHEFEKRVSSFGWESIIAKTLKGKGISFLEDKNGWHGKAATQEELYRALQELGPVDLSITGTIPKPENRQPPRRTVEASGSVQYETDTPVATRKAYGNALVRIFSAFPEIVVLDAEVGNSTYAEVFGKAHPERFFEMFIAEQNMVGAALGLSRRGRIPFVSTFGAFFTRAFDQIRMSQYSEANIKCVGSHAGVSIGEDGSSQMALEDIAMFRAVLNSVVVYPSDAVSADRLVEEAAKYRGLVYIRTTRQATPLLYSSDDEFPLGGSKTLRRSDRDTVTVIGAGITVHEALKAHEELRKEGIFIRVIDLYSIKPLDSLNLSHAATETKAFITVEDHFAEGGIGEAVRSAFISLPVPVHSLAVRKMPHSGTPQQLLEYEEISVNAIIQKTKEIL